MPRADPQHSFEAAAKHLFRHICDVEALRANPLVRRYFARARSLDHELLQAIQADVLALGSDNCRELELRGQSIRAKRRRAIVEALCAGVPAEQTAFALRISRSHYYRERNAIGSQIGGALRRAAPHRSARFMLADDPLRMALARAESLRDAGSANEAVRLLEDAHSRATDAFAKSAMGIALAEELVFLGRREPAREILRRAQSSGACDGEAGASEWLRDLRALNLARLESQLNADSESGTALARLAKRRIAEGRSDNVSFDAVFLSGESYRNTGAYRDARAMLDQLRTMERRFGRAQAKRQIAVLLLEAYCAEGSSDEFGVAEQSLRDARDLSVASGTVIGALLATSGLIHLEASRGREDVVYTLAHEALQLASGVDFDGFLGYVVAEIIDALMQTRYWRACAQLAFDAERLMVPGTLRHALLKRAQGAVLFRTGWKRKARIKVLEASTVARQLGNRRLEGLILRDRALMLSGEKTAAERAELMREAVSLIEPVGSASDLSSTYAAAARVLGDRRSRVLARQSSSRTSLALEEQYDARALRIRPLRLPRR